MSRALAHFTLALALFGVSLFQGSTFARGPSCAEKDNNSFEKLLGCVTLDGVRVHQAALQAIADANGGYRSVATPGYAASVAYAQSVLASAGYAVTVQEFQFQAFLELSPSVLEKIAPLPNESLAHHVMHYSGSGDVAADVSTPSGIYGCTAGDFAGFTVGNIALISRGPDFTCKFSMKATHAFNAGAVGVVIYNNEGGELHGTLEADFTLAIPVVGITQTLGQQLALTPVLRLHLKTNTTAGLSTSYNVLAESKHGDPENVVMAGAHLDSVLAGPGIQDNGSGVAAILEIARMMGKVKPRNKLRFALWGAEEVGLVGSGRYLNGLSPAEQDHIALYLNFDMIASPNYGLFILDGDDSDTINSMLPPAGSDDIEATFEEFYSRFNLPFRGTAIDGRSDYFWFADVGIPVGGLFTGAAVSKTAEEASLWGGTVGAAFDPCFHQACDTYDNNSMFALDINSDAAAFAILKYAMSTEDVNGIRGKNLKWKKAKK